jgi:hypothetical protein
VIVGPGGHRPDAARYSKKVNRRKKDWTRMPSLQPKLRLPAGVLQVESPLYRSVNEPAEVAMPPKDWPLDPISAAALVARVIDDVDESTNEERDSLLSELQFVAWGNRWAQDQ